MSKPEPAHYRTTNWKSCNEALKRRGSARDGCVRRPVAIDPYPAHGRSPGESRAGTGGGTSIFHQSLHEGRETSRARAQEGLLRVCIASYARQAEDDFLLKMATCIKARAVRRAGELLKRIEAGNGARDGKRDTGTHVPLRTRVAKQAGFSSHQGFFDGVDAPS